MKTEKNVFKLLLTGLLFTGGVGAGAVAFADENPQVVQTPNDGQITAIMKTTTEAEIDAAQIAKNRARHPDVKQYANEVLGELKTSQKQGKELSKRLGIKPEKTDMTKLAKKDAVKMENELRRMDVKKFDKAYIGQQVVVHQALLDDLNNRLIPSAKNDQLRSFLEDTKKQVEQNLDRAQQIQTALNQ